MSLDRTEDVELVDAPTKLEVSKIWSRQYAGLEALLSRLERDRVLAVQWPDASLGKYQCDKLKNLSELYGLGEYKNSEIRFHFTEPQGGHIWRNVSHDELPDDLRSYIKFSTLRKSVVSFNRTANPDWNYEKAKNRLADYDELREELSGNEHIKMPELQLPPKPPTMAFITKVNELLQGFMDYRYNFEHRRFRVIPFTVVRMTRRSNGRLQLGSSSGMRRKILIAVGEEDTQTEDDEDKKSEADWEVSRAEYMVDITTLLIELQQLVTFYDAPSVYLSVMHHIEHIESFRADTEADDWEPSFP